MRITNLYNLRKEEKAKKIAESLIDDIKNLAEVKFNDNEFEKFIIRIRLDKIEKYEYR